MVEIGSRRTFGFKVQCGWGCCLSSTLGVLTGSAPQAGGRLRSAEAGSCKSLYVILRLYLSVKTPPFLGTPLLSLGCKEECHDNIKL